LSRDGYLSTVNDSKRAVFSAKFTFLRQPLKRYTFQAPKTRAWVEELCRGKRVLNLFGGPTRLIGAAFELSNDLDRYFQTTFHIDALDCVLGLRAVGCFFERVILDPPYSYRKSMEMYKGNRNSRFKQILDVLPDILTEDGWVITFGYHSRVMSASRGFQVREICLISHGGAQHDTIATVEERIAATKQVLEV
jgi:hypothetical protein